MNNRIDHDLLSIQEARILAENAFHAQKKMASFSQEKLDFIVEAVSNELSKHTKNLAIDSQEETDYGRWEDKVIKNTFVCDYLRRQLRDIQCVGIIKEDLEQQVMEVGVPLGVIVGLCPATSPVSTTIYKALIAIKSGNAIVFSPHPRARETMGKTLDLIIQASIEHGLPEGALSYLHTVSRSGTEALMSHERVSLVINTGVPGMLKAAYHSKKPVIYGGSGNGPAFIERTAHVDQAVQQIIASKSFDHGVVSAAEQSIVVDSCIETQVRQAFVQNGAYFMTDEEGETLGKLFFRKDGSWNSEMVGISAETLAERSGFSVPKGTKVLISEQKYVSEINPYSREKLCPVMAYYIESDWLNACEKCIELLISEKGGHTLVLHSNDPEVVRQFALKKPVSRVLVNTPATFGSMGATTNLFPAMTLGSGSTGQGITSDNVSPMNLVYIRKIAYGVRSIETFNTSQNTIEEVKSNPHNSEEMELLQRLLKEALEK